MLAGATDVEIPTRIEVEQPAAHRRVALVGPTTPKSIDPRLLRSIIAGVAVGDFNGDGKLDIATANNDATSSVSVLLGNGNGTFQAPIQLASGGLNPTAIAAGDFNGDRRAHLVVAFAGSPSVPASLNGNIGILINDGVWPQVGGGSGGGSRGGGGPAVMASRNLTLPSSTLPGGLPALLLGLTSDPSDGTTPGLPTPGHRGHGSNARS